MPAIGKDLSKIRSHLGLSIQDIQHETKIPVSTLRSIENGSIFDHPEENQTYIRSFVRSYGRALKIDDEVMINALDQHEIGNYNNLLLENYPELDPEISAGPQPEDDKKSEQDPDKKESDDEPEEQLIDIQGFEKDHDEEKTEIKQIEISDEPVDDSPQKESTTDKETPSTHSTKPKINDTEKSVKSVDWADVGRKFNQEKKHTPIWIIGLIIILLIAAFVSYFLYQNGFLSFDRLMQNDQQEQVSSGNEMSQRNLSLDLSDSLSSSETGSTPQPETTNEQEPSTELDDVLELTVYAAYDVLGPVRVWSDLKPRMDPYWLEQGTAMNFEFEDTIRVRGSYSNLLLLKDGHLVENAAQEFFSEEEDYIELTRDFFNSDPKWSTSIEYQLPEGVSPPDSIAIRPTF
ncbi:helix-turn-helix domain-containing protein [Rhodohalobacter sulfatireducens]|uniref:Helix-turn-helix domain-containing protein n=1 Tax=Rhodohalobacter sulfatireducens TaxID=2911366 RepID=A0ABS9KBY0_9BACT|nr:helix-turn-helix domain-containing protein [Rhodohalobacter sulfatireducens]MCG2588346.1 helix-turn-helix domain-containing protein [Rhodohalobacter sulfatireducens]